MFTVLFNCLEQRRAKMELERKYQKEKLNLIMEDRVEINEESVVISIAPRTEESFSVRRRLPPLTVPTSSFLSTPYVNIFAYST